MIKLLLVIVIVLLSMILVSLSTHKDEPQPQQETSHPMKSQIIQIKPSPIIINVRGTNGTLGPADAVIQLSNDTYQVPDNWKGCFVNPDDLQDTSFGCPGHP